MNLKKLPHDTDGTLSAAADFDTVIRSGNAWNGGYQTAPILHKAASAFWQAAFEPSALSIRMKELVLVALHGTITSLHAEGTQRHVERALQAGASCDDILDVLLTIAGVANHSLYFALPILMKELEAAGSPEAELPPISEEAQAVKDEFVRSRGMWNAQRDMIARSMPKYFSALTDISTVTWKHGSLSRKERELVCIAIDCSVTHMFEPGLALHIRHALLNGASKDEVLDVFQLASLTGLESYVLGAKILANMEASNGHEGPLS